MSDNLLAMAAKVWYPQEWTRMYSCLDQTDSHTVDVRRGVNANV